MGETLEIIKKRRSVRGYKADMVPKDVLDKIIEAGTYAATGMGRQSPIIISVSNRELRDKLSAMNVLADKTMPTYLYDGSLVMGNLMLAAADLGVDSCWIHRAKEEFESEEGKAILKELGITGDYEGIGHCVLGYAANEVPEAAPRKDNYVYYAE